MLPRLDRPRRRGVDFEIGIPCAPLLVRESHPSEDQRTVEARLGHPRFEAQRVLDVAERLRVQRRPCETLRGRVFGGGEVVPALRVVWRGARGAAETLDRFERMVDEDERDAGDVLRRRGGIAAGALDRVGGHAGEAQCLRIRGRLSGARGAAVRCPRKATRQPRLDRALRARRGGDEARLRRAVTEEKRGAADDGDRRCGGDSQPSPRRRLCRCHALGMHRLVRQLELLEALRTRVEVREQLRPLRGRQPSLGECSECLGVRVTHADPLDRRSMSFSSSPKRKFNDWNGEPISSAAVAPSMPASVRAVRRRRRLASMRR